MRKERMKATNEVSCMLNYIAVNLIYLIYSEFLKLHLFFQFYRIFLPFSGRDLKVAISLRKAMGVRGANMRCWAQEWIATYL